MKVLFIWKGVTDIGGVSTWILQCLHSLPSLGVDAYALDMVRGQKRALNLGAVENRIVRVTPRRRWESEALFIRRIGREVQKTGANLLVFNEQVHAEDFLEATRFRVPAVNVVHSNRKEAYPILEELVHWNVSQLCVSRAISNTLISRLSASEKALVHTTLLGVEHPEKVLPTPWYSGELLRLIYVGRLSCYQKNIMDMVSFLVKMRLLAIPFHLDVVGDGFDRRRLYDEIMRLKLAGYVTFHGAVPHGRALSLLQKAHIFLLFSSSEGLPLTLLEAMARGVVPLVTDLPSGISEVIQEHTNGLLFPVGQPERAAELVHELIMNRSMFECLRKAAIETSKQYSFEKQIVWFADYFRKALLFPPQKNGRKAFTMKQKIRRFFP